jgi:pimeloyl-ACP methyl ester carboxylesterase
VRFDAGKNNMGEEAMEHERRFDTGQVMLNYLDYGAEAGDPLVLLHGGAWRWQEYLSLIPHFAERWRISALDLRGNGRSGWVADHYRLEDFADDTVAFVRRLTTPAVLIGHSIGGVIALMVAERCPEHVKGLIIEDAPLTVETYRRTIEASQTMFRLWLALKSSAQSEHDLAVALAEAYQEYPGVTSGWLLFFASCLWQLDPTFFNALLQDRDGFLHGYDPPQIVASLTCPVLFMRGEPALGAVMTDGECAWLGQHCPQGRCTQIRGVGHLLHLEDRGAQPVRAAMLAFLESLPRWLGATLPSAP